MLKNLLFILVLTCVFHNLVAQRIISFPNISEHQNNIIITSKKTDSIAQLDIADILNKIFKRNNRYDSISNYKTSLSIVPGIDYIPSSGFRINATASVSSFASEDPDQKLTTSSLIASYSQKKQAAVTLFSNIWTTNNNYTFQGSWWYLHFPEQTYGLGSTTNQNKQNEVIYSYVRFYESILKKIYLNIYAGIGYKLDYHYDIKEKGTKDGSISDLDKYGNTTTSVSSGLSFDFLFDSRKNSINPGKSAYLSIVYTPKQKILKSDNTWQSLQLDVRKYITLAGNSKRILAFWSLLSFTNGYAPYLDLPSTGWDLQLKSSGRGYAQGRYRGKNMLYFESEYRFLITRNGLFGAVVFANAQSFSEMTNRNFKTILPAAGGGIRIKLSKQSKTNLCFDYGFGIHRSKGLFVNIGEIF